MAEVIHRTEVLNVSVSSSTSTRTSLRSPKSPGLSIERLDLNLSHTAEELDEKRENRRVYDYLCRLLEVRNWLVECLQSTDVPEEIELEANLSNGVLLARLANYFAPDIVPTSKIFDIDQSRYKRDGQPCYRHTDNIMLWRRAASYVHLPEILLPETVDVYEGRNIKTIFCLYALAIHLFRLRRGPPIRNQAGNAEFSADVMENMRERLKDSNIPAFGDVGGMLTTSPKDESANATAILLINKFVELGPSDSLLNSLKNPDAGILFVNDKLTDDYQSSLREKKSSARDGGYLSREEIQQIITVVNERDALRRLDELISAGDEIDVVRLTGVLDDLQQEGVLQHCLPIYVSLLYNTRNSQEDPLSLDQVENIIEVVNVCVRVKMFVMEEDFDGLYETLTHPKLHCEHLLQRQLKQIYLELLQSEYLLVDKNRVLLTDRIQSILLAARELTPQQRIVRRILYSLRKGDEERFAESLQCVSGSKKEFLPIYMTALNNFSFFTIEEVEEIIRRTNQSVLRAEEKARQMVEVNRLLMDRKRSDVQKLIFLSGNDRISNELSAKCVITLEEELSLRRRKFLQSLENGSVHVGDRAEEKMIGYLPETFENGVLYINVEDCGVTFLKPEKVNEWMLRSDDIQRVVQSESEKFASKQRTVEDNAAEKKRREEAAVRIQKWLRRNQFRRDLLSLRNSDAPTLRVVRIFINALVNTKQDIEKEAEIEDIKSRVTKQINANRHMEEQLQELDNKIALLVKNRINLQDVIDHGEKVTAEAREDFIRKPSVRKKDREQWNAYEMIIFHLQTEPEYLAKIVSEYSTQEEVLTNFFKRALLPTFNFAAEEREEYLLASLLKYIIKQEIATLQKPEDLRRTSAVKVTNLLLRQFSEKNVIKPKIAELCRQLEEKENQVEHFNLNVMSIFESVEGRSAASEVDAANNQQVRVVLDDSKQFLTKWAELFSTAVFEKSTQLPKLLQFLVKAVFADMKEKFPRASDEDVLQGVGGWMFKSCYEEQIVGISNAAEGKVDEGYEKRRAISRFIEFGVVNFGYGDDKWYLKSLNESLARINELAMQLAAQIVRDESEVYHRDKYSDALSKHRPTLHISLEQLNVLHRHLINNISQMIPNGLSKLRELIEKTVAPNADEELFATLFLHPMPAVGSSEHKKDPREVFQRTKRYVVECLLCKCRGDNLTELLELCTLEEEEERYTALPHAEDNAWVLGEQKRQIQENLAFLEASGLVRSSDHYQAIVTAIARDINGEQDYRKERKEQLHHLRATVVQLEEKWKEYNDRLAAYKEYLAKCLDNISLTSRRPSIRPSSAKAGKIIKQRESLDAIQKVKCSAEKLDKKGILLSVDGYTTFKEYNKLSVEICTTDRPGILSFTIIEPKQPPQKAELDFQELLRAEYNEEPYLKIAGKVNLHVQKLIAFLNKKFYAQ